MSSAGHSDIETEALNRKLEGVGYLHTQIEKLDTQIKKLAIVRDGADKMSR
jgi:hypothetical protein